MTQLEPLAQPKRWSESRKVQNSQTDLTMMTKKSSKLKHYTRTLINIYEDSKLSFFSIDHVVNLPRILHQRMQNAVVKHELVFCWQKEKNIFSLLH